MSDFVFLTNDEVRRLVPVESAVAVVREALTQGRDTAPVSLPKVLGTWEGGSLHALASHWVHRGFAGVKSWINTTAGAESVYCLFDATSGSLLAIMQASILGRMRTAAVGAIAIDRLARRQAPVLALLGTGRQAHSQLGGALAVRSFDEVRVWSPNPAHRSEFAQQAAQGFGVAVTAVESVRHAAREAAVVITVTRARTPFLAMADLAEGAHVNAMGAILPQRAELDPDVFAGAATIVVDDLDSALHNSSELRTLLAAHPEARERLRLLPDLLAEPANALDRPGTGPTVFKSLGLAACDLALAGQVYRQYLEAQPLEALATTDTTESH